MYMWMMVDAHWLSIHVVKNAVLSPEKRITQSQNKVVVISLDSLRYTIEIVLKKSQFKMCLR